MNKNKKILKQLEIFMKKVSKIWGKKLCRRSILLVLLNLKLKIKNLIGLEKYLGKLYNFYLLIIIFIFYNKKIKIYLYIYIVIILFIKYILNLIFFI